MTPEDRSTPEDRRRVSPVLFVVVGAVFALVSVLDDLEPAARLFGVAAGAVVAGYGVLRLRAERRRPPDDGAGPPPA
ncbi:MAG: hypothetical protein AVDCRST_MAG35-2765 [uncultured Quadrisphaera sp.]|uniref:Uncharacterized protein n=1 Tax=uncultured Quadrisphaera sp. TaxID=904978 RepID=A0A6J4Q6Q7_9ACTN|nr:MAG: hypothetical protein AVDCRST_MAG35-2765 [uncultured Quadrisphaera sp.]